MSRLSPESHRILDQWQADQDAWDPTVLCAFESTTGMDGVRENSDEFEAWLDTPAASPALAAYESAKAGFWISPVRYQEAVAFWQAAARAVA